jgi:hypothetical protein
VGRGKRRDKAFHPSRGGQDAETLRLSRLRLGWLLFAPFNPRIKGLDLRQMTVRQLREALGAWLAFGSAIKNTFMLDFICLGWGDLDRRG